MTERALLARAAGVCGRWVIERLGRPVHCSFRVRDRGEAWMSGTWDGLAAIRLSVSSGRTTDEDVDRTVPAFADALHAEKVPG